MFILVLTANSYVESIVDHPRSPTTPVPTAISSSKSPLLSVTPVRCMNTANFINVKVQVATPFQSTISSVRKPKNRLSSSESLKRSVLKTGNVFLQLDFQKPSHLCFVHKDNVKWCGGSSGSLVLLLFTRFL